jgi:hypothetical protein
LTIHILNKIQCLIQLWKETFEWYSSGPRQRLQPGGSIVVVMTRWAQDDLTGRLIKSQSEPKSDKWRVINFPAILDNGEPVWPEYWPLEELEKVKASVFYKELECTIHARPNFRRRCHHQKRLVE